MADRLTELQDAINLQAQNLCNAVGVIQQVAQPSFFTEPSWSTRATKPEYQALFQDQNQGDIAYNFATSIAATAKQVEILINSLPVEEVSLEIQEEATRRLILEYQRESAKLVHLITSRFQRRLSTVRRLLSRIAETQLLARTLEGEISMDVDSSPVFGKNPTTESITSDSLEDIYLVWKKHLYLCLIAILITRVAGHFLPAILSFLVNNLLPSARARRSTYSRNKTEICDLRRKLSELNMVDQFAAYSKLERKLKVLERQQLSSEQTEFGSSFITGMSAKLIRLAVSGLTISYLVLAAPNTDMNKTELLQASQQTWHGIPLGLAVFAVHYVPNRILTVLWIVLCESIALVPLSWLRKKSCWCYPV